MNYFNNLFVFLLQKPDAAAITGGVVGSFFGIVLLVLFAIVMIKRRQKRTDDTYKTTRSPSLTATTNSSLNSLQGEMRKATITRCDLSPRFFCIDATLLYEFERDKI